MNIISKCWLKLLIFCSLSSPPFHLCHPAHPTPLPKVMPASSSSPNVSDTRFYSILQSCNERHVSAFCAINILFLLPPYTLVLYLLVQRWWRRRQQKGSVAMSHSDHFTCHMVLIELIGITGCIFFFCANHTDIYQFYEVFVFLFSVSLNGQAIFHLVTCLERYVAVVHPIAYRGLRNAKGVRIRKVTIGVSWLLTFALYTFVFLKDVSSSWFISLAWILMCMSAICFCSFSVLFVLIHPRPGEGDRGKVDKMRLRAFFAITAILVVLFIKFIGSVICDVLISSAQEGENNVCVILLITWWFCLPSSLLSPLLFLLRAGKLGCANNCGTE